MLRSGLAFIVSHLAVDGSLPVQLIPDHVFRAATDDEITQIKRTLQLSIPSDSYSWVPYEGLVKAEHRAGSTSFNIEPLPREKWKYWAIAFDGQNGQLHELELVAQLLPFAFDVGFVLFYELPSQQGSLQGRQTMPMHIVEKYGHPAQSQTNAESVTSEQIASIGTWFDLYRAMPGEYEFVKIAIANFADLRRVPKTSDLVVVGLFSIIESLITHAPRLTETLDSINHQITNKIVLLRKRYGRPVVPSAYFLHAAEESIWKKLYSYRSSVAHGTPVSIEKTALQVLRDRDTVIRFLQDNVKELLLLGMREPGFLFDLRRC